MSGVSGLERAGAATLRDGYATGQFTPVDATRAALAAIEDRDGELNAFVLVDADGALEAANASTRRWREGSPLGPADGIPTSVKDIFFTAGWPTLRGSSLIDAAGPWPDDAPAVARLREGGAVLLGKTTTPEFAWKGTTDSPRHGVTGNPHDPARTAGGSSGGAAAAVAAGMGTWAIGTDGGGSVRIPAAFTGTVAIKPTYARIPLWPASPFGTLAHAGPITRTVTDCAELLDVIAAPDPRDWSGLPAPTGSYAQALQGEQAMDLTGLRVAFSPGLGLLDPRPDVLAAVERAVGELQAHGARVEQVDPPLGELATVRAAFEVLWFTGAAKVLQAYGPDALARVDAQLAEQVRRHAGDSASAYLDAMAVRMQLGRAMGEFHMRYDVLLSPSMPVTAFAAARTAPEGWSDPLWTSWTPYTYPFNMTQQPAMSLPCGTGQDGMPVGLQVVGPRHAEARVLQVARAYEQIAEQQEEPR